MISLLRNIPLSEIRYEKQTQHQNLFELIKKWHYYRWKLEKTLSMRHGQRHDFDNQLEEKRRRAENEIVRLEGEFDRQYPTDWENVAPTRLGNIIAANDDYADSRYGMDSVVLWPRLLPLLKQKNYFDLVAQEKSVFDFILNSGLILGVLGFELAGADFFLGKIAEGSFWLALTLCLGMVCYEGLIWAAQQWGITVRAAFDLYRDDLYDQLRLRKAKTFKQEREQWQGISNFLAYRRANVLFDDFIPQTKLDKRDEKNSSCLDIIGAAVSVAVLLWCLGWVSQLPGNPKGKVPRVDEWIKQWEEEERKRRNKKKNDTDRKPRKSPVKRPQDEPIAIDLNAGDMKQ